MGITQAVRNPGTYVSRTVGLYWALLTDPERFYDDLIGSRGIGRELLLVLVVGAVGTVGNYFVYETLRSLYTDLGVQVSGDVNFALWRQVLGPVLGIVALWIALTTALYVIGWLYSSLGEYFHLLKRTAWTMVPLVFANLIHTIAALYVAFTLTEDDLAGTEALSSDPAEQAGQIWLEASGEMALVVTSAVGVVFVAWVGYLAAYAVLDVRKLELGEAYRVAAVPVAAYGLYVLYQAYVAFSYSPGA